MDGSDESKWLGWLNITEDQIAHNADFKKLAEDVKSGGFSDILLLGMGGSSLGPEVLVETFGQIPGFPKLHVLDSTDPAQVKAFENKVDLAKTLFVVSSKSGSHARTQHLQTVFLRTDKESGWSRQGRKPLHSDHRSGFEDAESRQEAIGFGTIFPGLANIGGRYSVLSNFGMVPAAAMGIDTGRFLNQTQQMVEATCHESRWDKTRASFWA